VPLLHKPQTHRDRDL